MNVLYVTITFISIIFTLKLLESVSGSFKVTELNAVSFMYYLILFPNTIGSTLILIGLAKNHYIAKDLVDVNLNILVWILCVLLPIFLFIIMGIISFFKLGKLSNHYKIIPVEKPKNQILFSSILIILSTLPLISAIYTFRVLSGIPLLKLISVSPYELSVARYKAKFEFGGNVYIKNFTGIALSVMLSYIAYVYGKINKSRVIKFLWIYNGILSILLLTYDYEKGPIVFYFVGYILIQFYLSKKIELKRLVKWSIIIIIVTMFIAFFTFKYENFLYLFTINGPFGRLFIGQIVPLYYHFIYFPKEHDFLYGMSYPKIISMLTGSEYIRSSKIVMDIYSTSKFAGYMNTIFIAEAYANWGWMGILLSIFIVGIVYGILYTAFIKTRKTPVSLGIFIYIFIEMAKSINGGFYDFIYNPSLYFAFALLILLQYFYTFQVRKGD
jgi:hypothetical protein